MKQLFLSLIVGVLIFSHTQASAQKANKNDERWERYRNEKVAFFTTNLDLTPEEAQSFWPIYNQMEKEKRELQRKRHSLEDKVRNASENLSDDALTALTFEYVATSTTEANLKAKYNDEFLKILPPLKVIKLYKAENEFRMHMFRKYRERRDRN